MAAGLLPASCDEGPAPQEPRADPVVRLLSPDRVTPGQAVTIAGFNFGDDAAAVTVTFGGRPGSIVTVEPERIVALLPADAAPGPTPVVVRVSDGPAVEAGAVTVVLPSGAFTSVSAGGGFTCGIRAAAGAYCWGSGARGALGDEGADTATPVPVPVSGGTDFVSVSAGSAHACALDTAGSAFCWGSNDFGQLGVGAGGDAARPVPVGGGLAFATISAGFAHTCAVTPGGSAYCWGANESGQLGDGSRESRGSPAAVSGDVRFASVSAGGVHTCGRAADGRAYCWGDNGQGELGTGSRTDSTIPVEVAGGLAFDVVVAGNSPAAGLESVGEHSCGVARDGRAYCWGYNGKGQLGNGSLSSSELPVPVSSEIPFREISAGAFYTCAITSASEGRCWGQNDSIQLGSGATNAILPFPVLVLGALRLTSVSAGEASKAVLEGARTHTCGMDQSGTIYCWGSNREGQLGSGSLGVSSLPVPVGTPE
ncbi:MAG: IPT/TIG domain-containing protein [Gemmatimonadota bacterium]